MKRREALKTLTATTLTGGLAGALAPMPASAAPGETCGDGTPRQFEPKTPPNPNPLQDELAKYPKCPYCGMDRRQWHHSRHLVHYDDGRADGTCSIHCLAISLSLNIDRGPKAIYAADFGADAAVKPLMEVDRDGVTYLMGSDLRGTMTAHSKMAFASADAARAAQAEHGGELGDFDAALTQAYLGMARDTRMIRKRRAERRRRMQHRGGGES